MMEMLSIVLVQGSPPVLRVSGEIDMSTAEQLRSEVEDAMFADPMVVIDMSDVSFIDLSGVRALLEVADSRNGHGPLRLWNAPAVARLLHLAGLDEEKAALEISRGS